MNKISEKKKRRVAHEVFKFHKSFGMDFSADYNYYLGERFLEGTIYKWGMERRADWKKLLRAWLTNTIYNLGEEETERHDFWLWLIEKIFG